MSRSSPSLRNAFCGAERGLVSVLASGFTDGLARVMGQLCLCHLTPFNLERARPALKHMSHTYTLSDFDFELPESLIAQHPASERSASRLLDGRHAEFANRTFKDLPSLLKAGDLLVFNDTQVVKARLFGEKPTGGKLELLVERVLTNHEVVAHMKVSLSLIHI